jgi:hypothetical protein
VENWGGMFLTVYLYESASVLEVVVVFVAAVVDTVGLGVTEDAGVDVWRTWGLTLPPGQLRSSGLPGSWIFFWHHFQRLTVLGGLARAGVGAGPGVWHGGVRLNAELRALHFCLYVSDADRGLNTAKNYSTTECL